ncbi:acetyltransferase [Cylindrospermopsis curvispora]|uniref:Acetyltransferase n=1 Tax=Cylindrospermopsis curvispora GIHE-G1 TaxID=2666332 RepID=A0A7H0F1R3_9CYAN|nr:acetyltransferase [Cylindrospermopsis curvispora]QNP29979.1 acetyltransferase [Cylindrospermopsis curvispora GIHE-G1]
MKPVIIFGAGDLAQVSHFYLTHDSDYTVEAFTVDRDYLSTSVFCGLPVVPFEDIEELYSPEKFAMFIAISYTKINAVRAAKYETAKAKGYELISYVSSKATTWPDLSIGENCFILEDNTIQPFVKIGNNVTLWSGNHIGHHATIGDNCFITSHVVISGGVNIGKNCFIGVNATIRDHINIGDKCVIGAGSLVLSNAESEGVYMGTAAERSKVPSKRIKI